MIERLRLIYLSGYNKIIELKEHEKSKNWGSHDNSLYLWGYDEEGEDTQKVFTLVEINESGEEATYSEKNVETIFLHSYEYTTQDHNGITGNKKAIAKSRKLYRHSK